MLLGDIQRYPFLRLLVPLVCGIAWGEAMPFAWPWQVWMVGVLLLIGAYRFSTRRGVRSLFGVTAFLLLFGIGGEAASRRCAETDFPFQPEAAIYQVQLETSPEEKPRSLLCRSFVTGVFEADTFRAYSRPFLFLLYFPKDSTASALRSGDKLLVHTRLSPPVNNGNPDEFDYARYLRRNGGSGSAYVPAGRWQVIGHDSLYTFQQQALQYRDRVTALYRRLGFQGDELAVLASLTVGARQEMSDEIVETYSVTGATHVLSISGLHVGFLYALIAFLLTPLWKRWRWLKPVLLLGTVILLWGFAFLTGLSSPVVRAVSMCMLWAFAFVQPDRPLALNTLAATAFFMLLWQPMWLFDVGFQLSFVAVASIVLLQPKLYCLWPVKNRFLRAVWGVMTVSIAAQIGTAPLVMYYFSRFSTHFLLTNLWVVPMSSLVLYAAVVLLLLTPFPVLQQAFAPLMERLVYAQNEVLRWIEHFPFASIDHIWLDGWEVLLIYICIGLIYVAFIRFRPKQVYAVLAALLLAVGYHWRMNIQNAPRRSIEFYNVRQCPVVHCVESDGSSWLVCTDSLMDVSPVQRSLAPHWNRLQLEEPMLIKGAYESDELFLQNQLLCYGNRWICLLNDDRWRGATASHPLPIDYLYVSKGYKGDIRSLTSLFSIRKVVFDASLSRYYREKMIQECITHGISYVSLEEKGAYRVRL